MATVEERFWSKVRPNQKTDCWEWTAGHLPKGYGVFYPSHEMPVGAHRFAYELVKGPIADGLVIDHLCNRPHCVNPAHLQAVTQRENLLGSDSLSEFNRLKTHCFQGHPLVSGNLQNGVGRRRRCLTCHRKTERERRARLRGGV